MTGRRDAGRLLIWLLQIWSVSCLNGPECETENDPALVSGANDVIVVRQMDGRLQSTSVQMQVGKMTNWRTLLSSRSGHQVKVMVNGEEVDTDSPLTIHEHGVACFKGGIRNNFTDAELRQMFLRPGANPALFTIDSLDVTIPFVVFLMNQTDRLVVTDIDGTITKSDFKGFLLPQIGVDYHQDYVVELMQKISGQGYIIVYLTARPLALSDQTKKYLFQQLQNKDGYSLPPGPVLSSPSAINTVFSLQDPSDTKATTILSFLDLFDLKQQVVKAAYGNQKSDQVAYEKSGIKPDVIYITNEEGQLSNVNHMSTYADHVANVTQMYPAL